MPEPDAVVIHEIHGERRKGQGNLQHCEFVDGLAVGCLQVSNLGP